MTSAPNIEVTREIESPILAQKVPSRRFVPFLIMASWGKLGQDAITKSERSRAQSLTHLLVSPVNLIATRQPGGVSGLERQPLLSHIVDGSRVL